MNLVFQRTKLNLTSLSDFSSTDNARTCEKKNSIKIDDVMAMLPTI